ncbi:MAG: hypothetical protein V1882_02500 [Candidatus Omnitrophota bacterium]
MENFTAAQLIESKEALRQTIERILKAVDARNKAAVEAFAESNRFEFDVCKLILNGTAGAFFLYISGVSYFREVADSHLTISLVALASWAVSLLAGVAHMLLWSHRLHVVGETETEKGAFILKELIETKEDPEKLLSAIAQEELQYTKEKGLGKPLDQKNFKYVVVRESYNYWLIIAQIVLLLLGACAGVGFGAPFIQYW